MVVMEPSSDTDPLDLLKNQLEVVRSDLRTRRLYIESAEKAAHKLQLREKQLVDFIERLTIAEEDA